MKRIALRVATALLTFILGTTISTFWQPYRILQSPPPITTSKPSVTESVATPPAPEPPVPAHDTEIKFRNGMKLVSNEVQLKNEILRYKVDLIYPQIEGWDTPTIRNLNKHIERLTEKDYQWMLEPSKQDLRYYKINHPEAFNTLYLDYEVILATETFLSIYFEGYCYGIGAAHSVQYSFVVNYDLVSFRILKLSDVFKPGSKYLEFISEYCIEQLSPGKEGYFDKEELGPVAQNFESWNMTKNGIRFNFDACKVFGCADGEQTVEIPFTALKHTRRNYGN
jgi:hypothetical protein